MKPILAVSPCRTEALIPRELFPVGAGPRRREVDPQGRTKQRPDERDRLFEGVRQAAEKANSYLRLVDTHLEFFVSEETGRVVVCVVESDSQEVIRRIHPDRMMQIADRIDRMRGLLFGVLG